MTFFIPEIKRVAWEVNSQPQHNKGGAQSDSGETYEQNLLKTLRQRLRE